ncbi:carbonic anhydrase family protein [Pediococcus stilesii]|uniref:carbonic anhydrase n=1 Tax=Pediococcus stilesii TaxID=331679 RepID=A0A5R9BV82_9LACO|nr:carbonic anhydrase family protein [Pediococcus stilesii]TLQ03901.1 carbonic anhydrase family protein [Pediococcus stilesii]
MEKLDYKKQDLWQPELKNIQSPIRLIGSDAEIIEKRAFEVTENYFAMGMHSKINNLSILAQGQTEIDGRIYSLQEVHFHHVAEHGFEGEEELRPLEIHFVHQNSLGQVAVVAVTMKIGKENPVIQKVIAAMQDHYQITEKFSLTELIPTQGHYLRYLGSLTTPPLSEGVEWVVFESPQELSLKQLDQYVAAFPDHNNRKFQEINGRTIQRFSI